VRRGDGPAPDGLHPWAGDVTDLAGGTTTLVRELWAAGTHLAGPMVWSEVFARCDDPGARVRWSGLQLGDAAGGAHEVASVTVNYQSLADGGCVTTDSSPDATGIVQSTGTTRITAQGARLAVPTAAEPGGEP
jgi:hypothetical protein